MELFTGIVPGTDPAPCGCTPDQPGERSLGGTDPRSKKTRKHHLVSLSLQAGMDGKKHRRHRQNREKSAAILPDYLAGPRSEEHTSELQSRGHLVCRLMLEKKESQH